VTPNADDLAEITKLIEAKKIRPIVTQVLPLNDGVKACEQAATHHTRGKIVLKIADGDARNQGGAEKRGELGFLRGVDPGKRQFVAIGLHGVFRHDIEQKARKPGVREVRRNARAHGTRAEHNRFLNATSHNIALWNENETAEQVTKPASAGQTGVW
jgi:hypothetical protein